MANWEGSLERSPLEVEYRTRGSLLAKISTVLAVLPKVEYLGD